MPRQMRGEMRLLPCMVLRVASVGLACTSLAACCDEYTLRSIKSDDGATARVVSRECGATVGYITKVMIDSHEVLRMNADARTVSVRWEGGGRTLFVSIPDEVSSRDIFLKENTVDRRTIKYERGS